VCGQPLGSRDVHRRGAADAGDRIHRGVAAGDAGRLRRSCGAVAGMKKGPSTGERAELGEKNRLSAPSAASPVTPRWLLLAHQLPTKSSNARVKTWRRLRQLGAIQTRNSVYVLPNTDQCREDFEWMRSEIVALGGEATVFAADAVDATGSDEIEAAFRRARAADYAELTREAKRSAGKGAGLSGERATGVNRLRERLNEIRRIDFFHAPAGDAAADAVDALAPPASRRKERAVQMSSKEFTNR